MKGKMLRTVVAVLLSSLVFAGFNAWGEGKKEEATTLKYWYQTQPPHTDMIKDFEAKNPSIRLEPTEIAPDQLNMVIRNALAAGTGPDVMYGNLGVNVMGPVMKAGLVIDLEDAADQHGWRKRLSAFGMGEATHYGKLWAIPNESECIVMYYNKDIYKKLGITVPQTWEELVSVCDKAAAAKYEPISYGYSNKSPAHHRVAVAYEWGGGTPMVTKAILEGGTLNTPEFIEGMRIVGLELDKKYMPNVLDRSSQEGSAVFLSGEGAMTHTGTWFAGDNFTPADAEKFGMFLPVAPGKKEATSAAGAGSGWYASSQSKYPEACLKFLDYTVSDDCAQIWIKYGYVPSLEQFEVPAGLDNPFFNQVVEIMGKHHMGYFLHHFISAETDEQLKSGYQMLLLGQITPEEYCQKLDSEHQKAWKEGFRP